MDNPIVSTVQEKNGKIVTYKNGLTVRTEGNVLTHRFPNKPWHTKVFIHTARTKIWNRNSDGVITETIYDTNM